jgi:hypothetical protein
MRVPKTFYSNGFMINFTVKHKEIFYHIHKWNIFGNTLSLLSTGKYNNQDPKFLITSEIKSCEESK